MNPHFLEGGPYYLAREVADFLRVSLDTVYRLTRSGALKGRRISENRVIYSQADVDAFLESRS